jgi:hypothetical protein
MKRGDQSTIRPVGNTMGQALACPIPRLKTKTIRINRSHRKGLLMTTIDHQNSAETLEQQIDRLQNHAWIGDSAQRMGELHAVIATLWAEVQATRKPMTTNFEPKRQRNAALKLLAASKAARRLILDLGKIVRGLDGNHEWLEFWTNDGDYLCCDSRYDDIVAAIAQAETAGIQPEPSAVRENIQTGGAVLARLAEPPRFAIEQNPAQNSDRLYVLVDDKFGVAIIRTDEGVVVDVYPKNGFETIASTYAFDSDAEESDDALTKPTETQGATHV